MPVVTVIGGSNKPFSVPFTGHRKSTLGAWFEKSFTNKNNHASSNDGSAVTVGGGSQAADTINGLAANPNVKITQSGGHTSVDDGDVAVDASGGKNWIVAGANSTVFGGNQDTISATSGNLHVVNGNSQTIHGIVDSGGGVLTFLGGTGDNRVQAGQATIFGTSNSTYHYEGNNAGNTQIYFEDDQRYNPSGVSHFEGQNGAGNILFDASSSHGSLDALVGNGDTIKGGTASDTISVNNIVGDDKTSATLSGGQGAPNLFQFLNDKGGHYTITDFGNAAGNKVGVSSSQMGNIQHMLDTSTISGGNTTIDLDEQTKITFLNATHLKPSDFHHF